MKSNVVFFSLFFLLLLLLLLLFRKRLYRDPIQCCVLSMVIACLLQVGVCYCFHNCSCSFSCSFFISFSYISNLLFPILV